VNATIGQAGEYLAAAILIEMEIQTMVSPTAGADLLAFDCGRHWRIEVKTANKLEERDRTLFYFGTARGSRVKTKVTNETCDILALVALPFRRVIFRHVNEITSKSTRLSKNRFVEGCERESWTKAIAWI
jgi:hypothetical protein